MESRWGHWDAYTRTIAIAVKLIQQVAWTDVLEILKHEMAHQIASELWQLEDGHGAHFQKACDQLGVMPWARRAAVHFEKDIEASIRGELTEEAKGIHRKVQKLLQLSQSCNQHESVAALRKVNELMRVHRLSSEPPKGDFAHLIVRHKKKRLESYHASIASLLTAHYGVQVIFSSEYDAQDCCEYKTIEILGRTTEAKMAEYIYWFLFNNLAVLWRQFNASSYESGRRARNEFFNGAVHGFSDQLSKDSSQTGNKSPESKSLIKLRNAELQTFVGSRFPRVKTETRYSRGGAPGSYAAGKSFGGRLKLRYGVDSCSPSSKPLITDRSSI